MLQRIENLIDRRPMLLGVALVLVGTAKYGVDLWPGWTNMLDAVQHWPDPKGAPSLVPPQDYILGSPVMVILGGWLRAATPWTYVGLSMALTLVALVLPFAMPLVRNQATTARILFMALVGGPLLPLLLTWVGGYDAVTIIAVTLAVLSKRPAVSVAGWALMAFNHLPVAVIAAALWLPVVLMSRAPDSRASRRTRILAMVVGCAVGGLAVQLVTGFWGGVTSRAEIVQNYGPAYYFNTLLAALPLVIFSSLGVVWVLLLTRGALRLWTTKWLIAAAASAAIAIPMIALDQSRTIALVLSAVTIEWAVTFEWASGRESAIQLWRRFAIAAVIIPVPLLLSGSVDPASWQSLLSLRGQILGL